MGPQRKNDLDLFLLSVIALFLELAAIRWLSSEIRIFAYFKNLPLMGAFLGFGVGFLLHDRWERMLTYFPRLFFVLVFITAAAFTLGLTHVVFVDPRQYFLLGIGFGDHAEDSVPSLLQTAKALFVIVGVFFLIVATFASLTARLGALLNREKPLIAYSINIAGSLVGIIGFSLVSYLRVEPWLWLVIALVPLYFFFYRDLEPRERRRGAFYFVAAIAWTLLFSWLNPALWSPYYRIAVFEDATPEHRATHILVNYDGFQTMQDLSDEHIASLPPETAKLLRRHYDVAYALSRRPVKSVLILGGGSGNDAAAALRNGAEHVDVVEIDPVVADLGRKYHPERPYESDRLELHVDDARSFLQSTKRRYDLIVFATLDSHAAFSSLSSLRMDNFVFTRESIRSAKNLLEPGGGIAINFFAIKPWLTQRHFNTLAAEMDTPLLSYASPGNQEISFLAGDLFDPTRPLGISDFHPIEGPFAEGPVEETTDDWPFLFLESRGVPFHYLMPLALICVLSLVPLRLARVGVRDVNWQLFFMGAAFLLIETKAVTALALILGSTWVVTSIVIGAIMLMILLANFTIVRFPTAPFLPLYSGLFVVLLLNYFFPFDLLNAFDWSTRLVIGAILIALPMFFAALIFARAFEMAAVPSKALAANVFGSLLGGVLEYLDMWTGLSALNLIALLLYALSGIALYLQLSGVKAFTPRTASVGP